MTQTSDFAEQTRAVASVLWQPIVPSQPAEAFLRAGTALLKGVESVTTAWLRRRHETVLDTQLLFARMRNSHDLIDAFKAQQDWVSGSIRRLTEDAESCGQAALEFFDGVMREGMDAQRSAPEPASAIAAKTRKAAD